MKKATTWMLRTFAALAVAGALTFGVHEVTASVAVDDAAVMCETCSSQQECIDCCDEHGFDDGFCTHTGACLCD